MLTAGGGRGRYSQSHGTSAGARPFGRAAEVNLYSHYNVDGGTRAEGWWRLFGSVGWRGPNRDKQGEKETDVMADFCVKI